MNQMPLMKLAIASSTIVCAALLSFGWSEQGGVSLSVETAQARVGRPLTPVSVAGVARRQNRRAAYGHGGYGYGLAGAAAVGTAAAVAPRYYGGGRYAGNPNDVGGLVGGDDPGTAPSSRWGWGGGAYYAGTGGPYYGRGAMDAQASYAAAPTASPSGWYLTPNGMACPSGTWIAGGNGLPFRCP